MGASHNAARGYLPECQCPGNGVDKSEKLFPPVPEQDARVDRIVMPSVIGGNGQQHVGPTGMALYFDEAVYGCAAACTHVAPTSRATTNNQLLLSGAEKGDVDQIVKALAAGAKIHSRRAHVMVVAASDAEEAMRSANTLSIRGTGMTALMRAAHNGHAAAVAALLQRKASPLQQDEDGLTALHFAAMGGSASCCKLLQDAGAPCDVVDDNGKAPIDLIPSDLVEIKEDRQAWEAILRPMPKNIAVRERDQQS
mmetsp:Transcript_17506/g.40776  ORF Transcript_17506/g.40776 Transcript_17506/m.40776 type:complete len:253 (+) Transcript_17506:50-808(+)